jgi:GNAT superfamily N-acetyltransferase
VTDVLVRSAEEDDLAAIAAITVATGQQEEWGGTNPAYVRHLMAHGRFVVAEVAGRVSGFGAAQRIGAGSAAVTVLCDLFVDPAAHGRGHGRAMLTELWSASGRKQTFASRHAHAMPLYTSFGLDAWWPLLYLQGDPGRLTEQPGWRADTVPAAAAAQCELDWTGIDRASDYEAWAARPGAESVLLRLDGAELATSIVLRSGPEAGIMRLATAPSVDDCTSAAAVLTALGGLAAMPGQMTSAKQMTSAELAGPAPPLANVCVPAPHPAVRELLAVGWRVDDFDLFMASEPGLLDPRRAVPSPGQA